MKHRMQQGFTLIELLVVITIIAILASLAVPTFSKIQERGNQTKGISNCRQIITTLRLYSSDNGGNYPDSDTTNAPTTANAAFRLMFKGGQADNEQIFTCPASQYGGTADGNIGSAPEYTQALESGKKENHWAMAKGLNDSASGSYPLVWEGGTGSSTDYDPSWNANGAGLGIQGRTWSGGKVIIGMNDSSVALQKCTSSKGDSVKLETKSGAEGNLFTINTKDSSGAAQITALEVE